jgi:hypothetical protein
MRNSNCVHCLKPLRFDRYDTTITYPESGLRAHASCVSFTRTSTAMDRHLVRYKSMGGNPYFIWQLKSPAS